MNTDGLVVVQQDKDGECSEVEDSSIFLPSGSLIPTSDTSGTKTVFKVTNDDKAKEVFEKMAQNTDVEWSFVTYNNGEHAEVGNSHQTNRNEAIIDSVKGRENVVSSITHSHPSEPYPSSQD